jgi:signal transduction histidine kinase/HAMP domain-containing protein
MKLIYKILLIIGLSALLSLTAIFYLTYTLTTSSISNAIISQQKQLARQTMDKVDRVLHDRYQDIQVIAGVDSVQDILLEINNKKLPPNASIQYPARLTQRIDELTFITGPWDDISIVSLDGVIRYSTHKNNIGKTIEEHTDMLPHFTQAQKTPTYSDVFLEDNNKPTLIFAAPVKDTSDPSQKVIGVVITHLSWPVVSEVLTSIKGSVVDLYNSKGIEIANNDEPDVFLSENNSSQPIVKAAINNEETSEVTKSIDSDEETVSTSALEKGFLKYKGNKWFIVIEQPTEVAFAPARQAAQIISLILVPVIIFSTSLIILFVIRLLKPVSQLTEITKQFASGDFATRVKISSRDELGQLANAFNTMADKLQDLYTGLEQKVKEKTAELQKEKETVEQKVVDRTKQLADEQGRLQASINSLSIGYVMTDVQNKVLLINTAAENIMTLSIPSAKPAQNAIDVSSLRGKIDMTFIHNALVEHTNIWSNIEDAKKNRKNIVLKNVPYKMLFLNLYITPIVNKDQNTIIGTVLLIEDITEQKVLERSKDEFFSIASHELRTPLTAIRGNTSIIKDYYTDEIKNPAVSDIIDDIHASSLRLINIVNDFLDLSRLEQGKIQYTSEVFGIEKLCQDVLKEYDVTGSRKKIALEIEKQNQQVPLVYADVTRIRQIIVNLVGNAIKFTEQGSVKISFASLTNSVKVIVSDTGKGIPPENQKLLFRKFQQAESNILTRDNTKGTGLGLYISKIMIKDMGGEIALERSEIGKGSVFSITIPQATQTQKDEYAQKANKPQTQADVKEVLHG